MDGPPEDDLCSICHGNFNVPCQANCSHWFCGHCIMRLWEHGSTFQTCKCPLCRRRITLLVPTRASELDRHSPSVAHTLQQLETYNRRFGGGSNGLIQMILSAVYMLSPIDVIPEGILGIVGLLDDFLIVLMGFLHVAALYRSVLYYRHAGT
ncbi:E3 ubiquitin-protein ligase RNF170-like isoform X2 [Mangifera indica]|uniref:E3 ubiquitin-protein ligase RNF170-like isoform X2 n=1 Tax=Mangifera indica TaxID=29780 RepID=UPI001CFB824B|nr:E3 ubiquitin-protein ligase RNF170-like isoform X2 [Mangifera indica]